MVDIKEFINKIIEKINELLGKYGFPGIILLIILFGVGLLFIAFLPYVIGILIVLALLWYFFIHR